MYRFSDELSSVENRIHKIHNQIESMLSYNPSMQIRSKQKLMSLAQELEECSRLAYKCSGLPEELPENSGHLHHLNDENLIVESYSDSKTIVKQFSKSFSECCDFSYGVLQINQLALSLNNWIRCRYTPSVRNDSFHYKVSKIIDWIDAIIIKYGYCIKYGIDNQFIEELDAWSNSLQTDLSNTWQLPYNVISILSSDDPEDFTLEAIVIERIFKKIFFKSNPDILHISSVEKIVISKNRCISVSDFDNMIESCKNFVLTSSFDIDKYK